MDIAETYVLLGRHDEAFAWLEKGFRIKTAITTFDTIAIDSPEDLEKVISSLPEGI